jgi:hypothetical protein
MTLEELKRETRPTLTNEEVYPLFSRRGTPGAGRTAWYEALRKGACPLTPIRIGKRIVFATAEVQRVLGVAPAGPPGNGHGPPDARTPAPGRYPEAGER